MRCKNQLEGVYFRKLIKYKNRNFVAQSLFSLESYECLNLIL
jgi:hypothetical protein